MSRRFWLLKAEPDSRVVKGKDVKFSVDDFEAVKTSPWEGVRNYEARNLLREMKVGDQVLFYHSNCKNPGIAGFAEISKDAYPDYTAWDPEHPYYDPKTKKDNPKWFMPDVTFVTRAAHLVPLAVLRAIAASGGAEAAGVPYVGKDGVDAIKAMALITRGRLSVQRVEERAWDTIRKMAEKGGWDEQVGKAKRGAGKKAGAATRERAAAKGEADAAKKAGKKTGLEARDQGADEDGEEQSAEEETDEATTRNYSSSRAKSASAGRKRKAEGDAAPEDSGTVRRSSRRKIVKS
ncbi:DUF55-domain-containing protein [Schizophyllum fasciatum]